MEQFSVRILLQKSEYDSFFLRSTYTMCLFITMEMSAMMPA